MRLAFDRLPACETKSCSMRALSVSCHPGCQVTKFARGAATTFAPRASGATRNPAYKGVANRDLLCVLLRLCCHAQEIKWR